MKYRVIVNGVSFYTTKAAIKRGVGDIIHGFGLSAFYAYLSKLSNLNIIGNLFHFIIID